MRRPLIALVALALTGCFRLTASGETGSIDFEPPRKIDPADIALPSGYQIEAVARGFTYPTDVTFDDQGTPYVVEAGYSYGEDFVPRARLLRVEPDGSTREVASGDHPPWTGVAWRDGAFYVAEGGATGGGRIIRIDREGRVTPLVEGLPSLGDHHTNGPAFGPDGALYFSVGTATNSAVVGLDNFKFGWAQRHPDFHDVPCEDIVLRGRNYTTPNPLTEEDGDEAVTGAFVPFGTRTEPGQRIAGRVPCSGAVLRVSAEGGPPELVAWGFRNPFGLAFAPDGTLFATENGFDVRGSRPVFGAGDHLWRVEPGGWYGWPDFSGARRLDENFNQAPGEPVPEPVLESWPGQPPLPVASLAVHSSSNHFDFSRSDAFGHRGQAFIAQFGDTTPGVGQTIAPVGFQVVRVDVETGVVRTFAGNRGEGNGPASMLGTGGLERPVSARFDPSGDALYIVDFGVLTQRDGRSRPWRETGVLWRVTRSEGGQAK